MSVRKPLVAAGLLCVAATAEAGWSAVIPESASVTLAFIALGVVAFALRRRPPTDES